MPVEIEKKFLIKNDSWRENTSGIRYRQGYILTAEDKTVRVRVIGEKGFLTIKGKTIGATRSEYEYEIPLDEANELLENLCGRTLIDKVRYKIPFKGFIWEVDEFFGENKGLIVAEVELEDEDQKFEIPEWVGEEVTFDQRYYNANLVRRPYSKW